VRSEDDVRNMLDRFYDIDEEQLSDDAAKMLEVLEWVLFPTTTDNIITRYIPTQA
jgi:hypothetical protein